MEGKVLGVGYWVLGVMRDAGYEMRDAASKSRKGRAAEPARPLDNKKRLLLAALLHVRALLLHGRALLHHRLALCFHLVSSSRVTGLHHRMAFGHHVATLVHHVRALLHHHLAVMPGHGGPGMTRGLRGHFAMVLSHSRFRLHVRLLVALSKSNCHRHSEDQSKADLQ